MYQNQKHRGSQGFGFIEISDKVVGPLHRARFENEIMGMLSPSKATEILFHHRFPTSTPNTEATAHPIPVTHESLRYDYVVVHNGVISNADALKKQFEKEKFVYSTEMFSGYYQHNRFYRDDYPKVKFNDSESLAIDLALAIENGKEKTESYGSIAFIALQIEKTTRRAVRLYFGRNDRSPLNLNFTDHIMTLSSAGAGVEVKPHKLHYYDYSTDGFFTVEGNFQIGALTTAVVPAKHYHVDVLNEKYDPTTKTWIPKTEEDRIYENEMGFNTRRLPLRDTEPDLRDMADIDFDGGDENFGTRGDEKTPIEGYPDGLTFKHSLGQQIFYTEQEMEFYYINLIDDLEFWKKYKKDADREKNAEDAAMAQSMVDCCLEDEQNLRNVIKQIHPEAFDDFKKDENNVPIINS